MLWWLAFYECFALACTGISDKQAFAIHRGGWTRA